MQTNLLLVEFGNEDRVRQNLLDVIAKKSKLLSTSINKYEKLKADLLVIQEEYTVRIGRLYVKDNLLDLAIIRCKKINELMDCGLSYDEAIAEIRERLKDKQEKIGTNWRENEDEYFFEELKNNTQVDGVLNIRTLWRKLVNKFHPDLSLDAQEKKKREDVMKKINKAYKENDYETLKMMDEKELLGESDELSITMLEEKFVDIENAIIRVKKNYKGLRVSEWFMWSKKSKKERELLWKELERTILADIAKKEKVLQNLRRKYNVEFL